jgi:hypothetical protein
VLQAVLPTNGTLARRTRAVEELRRLSTVAESDDTLAEKECDHSP